MALLKLEVSLGSDAMATHLGDEVAVMLGKLIVRVLEDPEWNQMNLFDSNGNNIGQAWIEED